MSQANHIKQQIRLMIRKRYSNASIIGIVANCLYEEGVVSHYKSLINLAETERALALYANTGKTGQRPSIRK